MSIKAAFATLSLQTAVLAACSVAWSPTAGAQDSMPALKPQVQINIDRMRDKARDDIGTKVKGFSQSPLPPPNFPLPVYSARQISTNFIRSTSTDPKVNGTVAGMIMTKDDPGTAFTFYKTSLSSNGWKIKDRKQSKLEQSGKLYTVGATKGNTDVIVSCVPMPKVDGTVINIVVTSAVLPAPPKKKG